MKFSIQSVVNLILLSLLCSHYLIGQEEILKHSLLKTDSLQQLFIGIDNPFVLSNEAIIPVEAIKTLNCTLEAGVADNHFLVQVSQAGAASIFIKKDGKKIDEVDTADDYWRYDFENIYLPDPKIQLKDDISSIQTTGFMKAQLGLYAYIPGKQVEISIDSFKISFVRKKEAFAETYTNYGKRFNPQIKQLIKDYSRPGTLIIFEDIRLRCPGDPYSRRLEGWTMYLK